MKTINYSFIIPHKNSYELLNRCLKSIQLRNEIQIIVIDDNSDNTTKLKDVILKHPQVELYLTSENRGAGYARNVGLSYAKGKWILFPDADDYYDTNNLINLLNKFAIDTKTDMVYLNAQIVNEMEQKKVYIMSSLIDNYLHKRIYSEKNIRYSIWTPWTRMVKRHIIDKHNILFEEIPIGNDAMFSLNCSKYAQTITAFSDIVYFYYMPSEGSITCKKYNNLSILESRIANVNRRNELYKSVKYLFRGSVLRMCFAQYKSDNYNRDTLNHIRNIMQRNRINLFNDLINLFMNFLSRIFHVKYYLKKIL